VCERTPPPVRMFGEHRIECHLEMGGVVAG